MLNSLKFYRRWKGGIWWRIKLTENHSRWVNVYYPSYAVLESEDFTKRDSLVFPDSEFYQAIANIPRNGEWHNEESLQTYLIFAKLLRQRGLEDRLIIESIKDLYQASSLERNTNSTPKSYTWGEIQNLLYKF